MIMNRFHVNQLVRLSDNSLGPGGTVIAADFCGGGIWLYKVSWLMHWVLESQLEAVSPLDLLAELAE
jgi:hypothetical protein